MNELAGQPFFFEDFFVGQEQRSLPYAVGKAEIIEFARKWDPQPFHIDEAIAEKSFFGGLTCCSAHIFSIFCAISQKWESGVIQQPLASLGFDQMRMLKPLYVNDSVVVVTTAHPLARLELDGAVNDELQLANVLLRQRLLLFQKLDLKKVLLKLQLLVFLFYLNLLLNQ